MASGCLVEFGYFRGGASRPGFIDPHVCAGMCAGIPLSPFELVMARHPLSCRDQFCQFVRRVCGVAILPGTYSLVIKRTWFS